MLVNERKWRPLLPRHGESEEVREEFKLAGFNPGPAPCVCRGDDALGSIIGGMTGSARRDQVPVLAVRRISIEVHRGQHDGSTGVEIKQGLTGATPSAPLTVTFSYPSTDRRPFGWIAPHINH